jgi:chromosome segregation ATPase
VLLQRLKGSLDEASRRAKSAEDELRIVQRQLERMREAMAPGASAAKLGAILEENHELKDTIRQLQHNVRSVSACIADAKCAFSSWPQPLSSCAPPKTNIVSYA